MKKLTRYLSLLTIIALLVCSLSSAKAAFDSEDGGYDTAISAMENMEPYVPGEVVAAADSREHAESIAAYYKMTLKSYDYGIAVFTTSSAELSVLQSERTRAVGMPTLHLNKVYYICEDIESKPETQDNTVNSTAPNYMQWHHSMMNTTQAWEYSRGAGVLVAVIDTGVDIDHGDLSHCLSPLAYNAVTKQTGLNYVRDDQGHGTHVSGIIAADSDNGCGIAPDATLLVIKANNPSDPRYFEMSSMLTGVNYAVAQGAHIINMSIGHSYASGADALEKSTIAHAVAQGIMVVAAAGNDSYFHASYPAAYPEVIAVSAVKTDGKFDPTYSAYGSEVNISAPGTDIYSTAKGGGYTLKTGTSMSCPNVVGVLALLKSMHPDYTPLQLQEKLYASARQTGTLGANEYYGYGIANAYAAVLPDANLYHVTYDLGTTTSGPYIVRVAPGNNLIEPTRPLRDMHGFKYWTTDAKGFNVFNFTSDISNSFTLFAQWDEPAKLELGEWVVAQFLGNYAQGDVGLENEGSTVLINKSASPFTIAAKIIRKSDGATRYIGIEKGE